MEYSWELKKSNFLNKKYIILLNNKFDGEKNIKYKY